MNATTDLPAALQRLVAAIQEHYRLSESAEELWGRVVPDLSDALVDPELRTIARSWPKSHDRANNRYTNLLFYEDPEHGFVINGLVKDETGCTPVHDHGHAWVAYGLIEGTESILRYTSEVEAPADVSDINFAGEFSLSEGQVDVVPPWTFHAEQANSDRTVALMVRSAKVGVFAHRRFNPTTGQIYEHPGPKQIDYAFAPTGENR